MKKTFELTFNPDITKIDKNALVNALMREYGDLAIHIEVKEK